MLLEETIVKTKRNRHANAIAISNGACNPSGIVNAIIEALRQMREEENHGTLRQCLDPAVRLMVHQLAAICGMEPLVDLAEYSKWRNACRELSS